MKICIWILALAVTMWPAAYNRFELGVAYAASGTSTSTSTSSSTATCTDNRTTYRGHTDNNCYAFNGGSGTDNQMDSQNNNKNNNDQSSQQSSMMGMMAIAAGMAMMAAGAAMMASPPTAAAGAALMAAGTMLMMAGMQAMAAAKEMDKNKNQSAAYQSNLDALNSGLSTASSVSTATAASVSIDPSLLGSGKAGTIFSDLEQKTGISAADFVNGLNNGTSPVDMLAESSQMKALGMSQDKLNGFVDASKASGQSLTGAEALSQMGMSQEDINELARQNAANTKSGSDAYAAGGSSGASRSPSSAAAAQQDFSFAAPKDALTGASSLNGAGAGGSSSSLSSGVQSALDKSGITNRTLFQMVHGQYTKKTPMMFGNPMRKAASHADNPFGNLDTMNVEL